MKSDCKHLNFAAEVGVNRLTDTDGDELPIGYSADVRIKCSDCNLPFHFIGVDYGLSKFKPMVSVGGCELRVPIGEGELKLIPSRIKFEVGNGLLNSEMEN